MTSSAQRWGTATHGGRLACGMGAGGHSRHWPVTAEAKGAEDDLKVRRWRLRLQRQGACRRTRGRRVVCGCGWLAHFNTCTSAYMCGALPPCLCVHRNLNTIQQRPEACSEHLSKLSESCCLGQSAKATNRLPENASSAPFGLVAAVPATQIMASADGPTGQYARSVAASCRALGVMQRRGMP